MTAPVYPKVMDRLSIADTRIDLTGRDVRCCKFSNCTVEPWESASELTIIQGCTFSDCTCVGDGWSQFLTIPTRKERVNQAIDSGDIAELLKLIEHDPCACLGARNGEPLCPCKMTSKQVREAVSYFALKRGKLVRLRDNRQTLQK